MSLAKNNKNTSIVYQDRRYVGTRETFAYIAFDVSKSFNISMYGDRFLYDVLKIDLNLLALINLINGIWDTVNDTFIGAVVDKTRTRWGKFKPYLVAFAIPGTIGACIYWLLPLFLNDDPMSMVKFWSFLILALVREGAGTFRGIAETGMLATITPHPVDRTRLITVANFYSSFVENLPEILMGLLYDGVNKKIIKVSLKGLFVSFGVLTSIVSGVLAFWFFISTRERVIQSEERPSIMQGIRSIITNKPILLITLSDFLGAFRIGSGMNNYYIDVLGSITYKGIVGIPGGLVSNASYAYVSWARRKFSTRTLWILGGSLGDMFMAGVFFLGCIGGRGANGWFRKPAAMVPIIMLQETLFMAVYGIRKVIPSEMFNEAMDYCEWKNGYRTEGMTSTTRGLANKLVGTVSGSVKNVLMKKLGYNLYAGHGQQSDETKFALFAMATIIPFVTGGLLSIIPKLFYDLTGEKRERMYEELLVRREERQREVSDVHTKGEA